MKPTFFETRFAFREWLEQHHESAEEGDLKLIEQTYQMPATNGGSDASLEASSAMPTERSQRRC